MIYIGYFLIAFGIADFGLSYADTDLWGGIIGIQLPDIIWQYSSMIEAGIGFGLVNLATSADDDETGETPSEES